MLALHFCFISSREGQPLPEDVDVVGSNIFLRGPVELHLAGQYLCQATYRRHQVSLGFTIEVNPKVLLPGTVFAVIMFHHQTVFTFYTVYILKLFLFLVTFPPNISVNLVENSDYIRIECLASNAIPTANVSWIISQEVNFTIQSEDTSYNGSYSVKSVLTGPNCMAREYVVECVVDHPALMEKEMRQIALPVCGKTLMATIIINNASLFSKLVLNIET